MLCPLSVWQAAIPFLETKQHSSGLEKQPVAQVTRRSRTLLFLVWVCIVDADMYVDTGCHIPPGNKTAHFRTGHAIYRWMWAVHRAVWVTWRTRTLKFSVIEGHWVTDCCVPGILHDNSQVFSDSWTGNSSFCSLPLQHCRSTNRAHLLTEVSDSALV